MRSRIRGAVSPINRSSIDSWVRRIVAPAVTRGNSISAHMAIHIDALSMVIRSIIMAAVAILAAGESAACRQEQRQSYHHNHQGS